MKIKIGYHALHEQFSPSDLLKYVIGAERAGFDAILSSDHFYPWSAEQGQSGFAWSWLGAALQATSGIEFGIVNAPGQRYHPAIIAQASATLAEMFPQRFWIALGSGQFLNEHITGTGWPSKQDRNIRLKESAEVLFDLWAGKTVNKSTHFSVENAKLYTRPLYRPVLVGAALSVDTAKWVGGWADGLITASDKPENLKKVIDAFRSTAGNDKPIYLKVQLSYAKTYKIAYDEGFAQWRNNVLDHSDLSDLKTPEQFDIKGKQVTPDLLESKLLISDPPEQHVKWLNEFIDLGFEKLLLHNVNRHQEDFINDFGRHVIPKLKS